MTEHTVSAEFHRAFAAETSAAFAMLWEVVAFYGASIPTHVDPRPSAQAEALSTTIRSIAEKAGRRTLRFAKDQDDKHGWSVYSGGLLVATIRYDDDKIYEPDKPWIWQFQDINAPPDVCDCLGY